MRVMKKTITLRTPLPARATFAEKRRAADFLDETADMMTARAHDYDPLPDVPPFTIHLDDAKPGTVPDQPGSALAPLDTNSIAETMGEIGRRVAGDVG